MKNSFCEDVYMADKLFKDQVSDFHDKAIESMGLPSWSKIECPHCEAKINTNGIRGIALCLNARNIGDIAIEFLCGSCGIMNTVYHRKAVTTDINEFAECVKGNKKLDTEPVVEEEMYKLGYNNLMEKFIEEIKT
jgi:hypothetical protein